MSTKSYFAALFSANFAAPIAVPECTTSTAGVICTVNAESNGAIRVDLTAPSVPVPVCVPQIEVTFNINTNGHLEVTALSGTSATVDSNPGCTSDTSGIACKAKVDPAGRVTVDVSAVSSSDTSGDVLGGLVGGLGLIGGGGGGNGLGALLGGRGGSGVQLTIQS